LVVFRDFDFPAAVLRLLDFALFPLALPFVLLPAVLPLVFVDFVAVPAFVGSFFRFVPASSRSCFSLIDFAIPFDAPFNPDFGVFPRFAASAAPAAFCCFLDLAGIPCFIAAGCAAGFPGLTFLDSAVECGTILRHSFGAHVKNPIPFLRIISLIEGISFLVLLGIAMPLKYLANAPMAVKIVGWAHGVLFIAFGFALLRAMLVAKWSIPRAAMVFIAALLPFGPFVIDRRIREYQEEFEQSRVKVSN
jgi:integral membrane protein